MLGAVAVAFWFLSPRFLDGPNLVDILVQGASLAIVATGMAFVMLGAGIDLSVGAVMLVAAAAAGRLSAAGGPLALAVALAVGALCGATNALFVARVGVKAYVVTLSTLFVFRGLGQRLVEASPLDLPESLLPLGRGRLVGVPVPILVLAAVLAAAHLVLARTPFGRHVYAVGHDAGAARRAGLPVGYLLSAVYVISGTLAALGGVVATAGLGTVSPTFDHDREIAAVAAALLGGVSLKGGRGTVLPGVLVGAALLQTLDSGLAIVSVDPYLHTMALGGVLFLAVRIDALRTRSGGMS
jgi:ribose transport system permease protein